MNDIKKTILIVEDSIVQALAVQMLLEQCGVNVVRATSGEQGLSLARETKPDLICWIFSCRVSMVSNFVVCCAMM